jgi:L-fuconolactonase
VPYTLFDAYPRLAPLATSGSTAAYDAMAHAHGITAAVCVEVASAGADGEVETPWLVDQARSSALPRAIVAWAPLDDPAVDEWLGHLRSLPVHVAGVRRSLEATPDGFALTPGMLGGVRQLGDLGIAFDLVLFGSRIPEATELARRLPQVTFVLDHLGKPAMDRDGLLAWERDIASFAALPNVLGKVSGLLTEGPLGQEVDPMARQMIRVAIERFGPSRLMFGTDWPVCELVPGGVGRWLDLVADATSHLGTEDRESIMATTAMRTYFLR